MNDKQSSTFGRIIAIRTIIGMQILLDAWRIRQETVHQCRILLKEKRTFYKGAFNGTPIDDGKGNSAVPPNDFTADQSQEIRIQGGKLISTNKTWIWSQANRKWFQTEDVVLHRDGKGTSLNKPEDLTIDVARIANEKHADAIGQISLLPITLSLRPESVYARFSELGVEFKRREDCVVDSRPCVCIGNVARDLTFYLDKERDYMPVRITVGPADSEWKIYIELMKHESNLWVASSWVFTIPGGGDRKVQTSAFAVESCSRSQYYRSF